MLGQRNKKDWSSKLAENSNYSNTTLLYVTLGIL